MNKRYASSLREKLMVDGFPVLSPMDIQRCYERYEKSVQEVHAGIFDVLFRVRSAIFDIIRSSFKLGDPSD